MNIGPFIGITSIVLLSFLFFDWHARRVFIACAYCGRYGHGKSWNRAYKHYKGNWNFCQRMFWVNVFKEKYEIRFRMISFFSYAHLIISLGTILVFYINELAFSSVVFWQYVFLFFTVFTVIRFIYDNHIARNG